MHPLPVLGALLEPFPAIHWQRQDTTWAGHKSITGRHKNKPPIHSPSLLGSIWNHQSTCTHIFVLEEYSKHVLGDVFTDIFDLSLLQSEVSSHLPRSSYGFVSASYTWPAPVRLQVKQVHSWCSGICYPCHPLQLDQRNSYVRMLFVDFSSALNCILPSHEAQGPAHLSITVQVDPGLPIKQTTVWADC